MQVPDTGGMPCVLSNVTTKLGDYKVALWIFRSFQELLFLHKNNTMVVLLKTASVRVSSIQITQVRVQNKVKIVWKIGYIGDVSHA